MRRRTFLKSLGAAVCAAAIEHWPKPSPVKVPKVTTALPRASWRPLHAGVRTSRVECRCPTVDGEPRHTVSCAARRLQGRSHYVEVLDEPNALLDDMRHAIREVNIDERELVTYHCRRPAPPFDGIPIRQMERAIRNGPPPTPLYEYRGSIFE